MSHIFNLVAAFILLQVLSVAYVHADVDDFEFSSFEADYYLSTDEEGRSKLRIKERLVAEFPEIDQNKGLVREIPFSYRNRPLSFELESVQRNGSDEPVYDSYRDGPFKVIETGTDKYLYGQQEYKFTYTVRDVIVDVDGGKQELFWDVNGTGWRQGFDEVSGRVHLEDDIEDGFTGEVRCLQGASGEDEICSAEIEDGVVEFSSTRYLRPGENISMVLEFEPFTAQPFSEGMARTIRVAAVGLSASLAVVALVWALALRVRHRDSKRNQVVIPEYQMPEGISILTAAFIYKPNKSLQKVVAAHVVDLAVRGRLAIVEKESKTLGLLKRNRYELKLKNAEGLNEHDREMIDVLFGTREVGAVYKMGANQNRVAKKMQKLIKNVQESVIDEGYRYKVPTWYRPYVASVAAVLLGVGVNMEMYFAGFTDWRLSLGFSGLVSLFLVVLIIGGGVRALTDDGEKLFVHIAGIKDYIQLAEAERLRYLQSPEGAKSRSLDTSDKSQIIELYEDLLPLAVLFGQERQWSKVLGDYYEESSHQPAWYGSTGGFNASNFSSSVSSFSAAASSNSSGMSGGTSGGGGGGGGGGGR